MDFGKNLRTLRRRAGLKQKDLSETFGVALSTVAMWETGKRQPDLDMVKRISDFFEVSADELISDGYEPGVPAEERESVRASGFGFMTDELADLRQMLRTRPEVKMLFSVSKNASKEDIERAVAIIEALKNSSGDRS